MAEYYLLNLKNVSHQAEDWLSAEAFRFQALGISETLSFHQPAGEEQVYTDIADRRALEIYFAQIPPSEFLQEIKTRFPEIEFVIKAEQEKDWLAEWKKGFAPFLLTDEHWVIPSWCEPPPRAKYKIWIDPGMAFGTGTHETTQLMATEMSRLLQAEKIESCLDVGTGTGILAILARQLGIGQVFATEIEAEARRVARENFKTNNCDDIVLSEQQAQDLSRGFDLVVANIIDGVLVRLQDVLKARVNPGGWLFVSGIIGERESDFLAGFHLPEGKTWSRRVQKGDWIFYGVKF